ncbi:MAG: DUF5715 family protein [Gemmatimonadota bacterium]
MSAGAPFRSLAAVLALTAAVGCGGEESGTIQQPDEAALRARVEAVVDQALLRMTERTDSIDALLLPVPLLTPAQEAALLRYGNAEHLQRALALGVRAADAGQVAALRADGRLVQLEDSTDLWVVRELEHSAPYVTPDTRALLVRIGTTFHERLADLGLPAYRLEVTSVLRTPDLQADLRRTNANAAAASSHEYGTTLDIAYSSFAAPADIDMSFETAGAEWLEGRLERIGAAMLETAGARKSRELQAILGIVLAELQNAGDVLVRLERQQPVYHITVARAQPLD